MFTSNFKKSYEIGISIALYDPPYFKGNKFWPLTPSKSIFYQYKERKDKALYEQRYRSEILFTLNPHWVYEMLRGKIMLCHESTSNFCHRYIVADWIYDNLKINVPEI